MSKNKILIVHFNNKEETVRKEKYNLMVVNQKGKIHQKKTIVIKKTDRQFTFAGKLIPKNENENIILISASCKNPCDLSFNKKIGKEFAVKRLIENRVLAKFEHNKNKITAGKAFIQICNKLQEELLNNLELRQRYFDDKLENFEILQYSSKLSIEKPEGAMVDTNSK